MVLEFFNKGLLKESAVDITGSIPKDDEFLLIASLFISFTPGFLKSGDPFNE